MDIYFFPICQVRVIRFYVSCFLLVLLLLLLLVLLLLVLLVLLLLLLLLVSLLLSSPLLVSSPPASCRTSNTTSCPMCPTGPEPRLFPPSVPCRTSTASIRAQCSLPDLNHDPPDQWSLPDLNREDPCQIFPAGPQPRPSTPSVSCRTSTATSRSQWALPDLNGKNVRKDVR